MIWSVALRYFAGVATFAACAGSMVQMSEARVFDWECVFSNLDSKPIRLIYDEAKGAAYLIGTRGPNALRTHIGSDAISFMEELDSGVVQLATIKLKTGEALYSRHTLVFGKEFIPSQGRGTCKTRVQP